MQLFFYFICVLLPVKIISLILSRVNRLLGRKQAIPEKKTPDMWPELGSNPQRRDDKRFRALKISGLNHSATGPI